MEKGDVEWGGERDTAGEHTYGFLKRVGKAEREGES